MHAYMVAYIHTLMHNLYVHSEASKFVLQARWIWSLGVGDRMRMILGVFFMLRLGLVFFSSFPCGVDGLDLIWAVVD